MKSDPRFLKLTELKKENASPGSGFVEIPALRDGPHLIGSGPAERKVSLITTYVGAQLAVTETLEEISEQINRLPKAVNEVV